MTAHHSKWLEDAADQLKESIGEGPVLAIETEAHPVILEIKADFILPVCRLLHSDERFYFDQLSCLTAIDNGPEEGTMELIYHLNSIPFDLQLGLKCRLKRNAADEPLPSIDSVASVWRTAEWHEREAFDLMGIHFNHHPDLRRILLPADWIGYPLRKDYDTQEYYHGVKVDYE